MSSALEYNTRQQDFEFFPPAPAALREEKIEHARPFIKWVGGKGQLIPSLISRLPADFDTSTQTYIEPFIGGGAFLFWMLSHHKHFQKIIVNDANSILINTYRVIRDTPEDLIAVLSDIRTKYMSLTDENERKQYYYEKRQQFNSANNSNIGQAACLIFLNKTCFNGLYRVNGRGEYNVPHGRYANPVICDPEVIRADSIALQNTEISNGDFSDVLSEADERSFVYFDPPYRPLSKTSSFCSYCEGGFDDNEQRRLADCCKALDRKGVRWLLSNSDPKGLCPEDCFFENLYQGYNIQSVQANRMLNSNSQRRGKLSELLISNY